MTNPTPTDPISPCDNSGRFYDADALQQVAINLFYGWGYNFYRLENQLRADDQIIRSKAAWYLGRAVEAVVRAEVVGRLALPTPTRAQPHPDAAALAGPRALERMAKEIDALKGRMMSQPVPENDRMTQRHRQEAATLTALVALDQKLVGQCDLLCTMAETSPLARLSDLQAGLAAIAATLIERQGIFQT